MEGMFPSWLQAFLCIGGGVFGWCGLKPDLETQGFGLGFALAEPQIARCLVFAAEVV